MISTRPLAALVLASLCTYAVAKDPSWYAGVSAGQSKTNRELVRNRESTLVNASGIQTDFDAKDNAWKAFGGYRFTDMIAVEVHYADLGSHRTFTTMLGGANPPLPASILINRKITGYGADLLLSAPLGGRFSVFGRVGAFRSQLKADARLDGNIVFITGNPAERARSTKVDETVLRAAQLKNLMRKGYLARIYLHLLSLENFARLLDRKGERQAAS